MFRMMNKLKNRKGFTLIELIVVLAVLAIIAAIAVPRFLGIQEQAKIDADYATGAMLGKAAELYLAKDTNNIATLDTKAASSVADLATELKTTTIKFSSDQFNGKETTIKFTETNGAVTVKATDKAGNVVTLYPK